MPISKTIARQLENASWIRRMFEEGIRLKRERGADAICDFSLGNPDVEPPPAVLDALRRNELRHVVRQLHSAFLAMR